MSRDNFVERQIDAHLQEEEANDKYAEQCQAWVDDILPDLMAQAQETFCIELPNNSGKHTSTTIDEILIDNDSQRYYKCAAHMLNDDTDTRERFGRQAIFAHLEECLDRHLYDVSDHFVKR